MAAQHPTGFVCKHCKVDVVGKDNFRPILGKSHKPGCPRKRVFG